jgi:hypothetical protein
MRRASIHHHRPHGQLPCRSPGTALHKHLFGSRSYR